MVSAIPSYSLFQADPLVTDQSIEELDFDDSELDISADEEEEEDARPRKKTKV